MVFDPVSVSAAAACVIREINDRLQKQRSLPLTIPQAEVVKAMIEETMVAVQVSTTLQ